MPGILIADDNRNIRALLRNMIESRPPAEVRGEAANGVEAIELAKELQPDIIVIDFSMPLLNGAIAAALLKRTMPRTKVVLFTLHADDFPKTLQRTIGADLLISKTDDITQLPDRLTQLLGSESQAGAKPPATREADTTKR